MRAFFLFLTIFCCIYQDFPLVNTIGEIGRSPIILITPFLIIYLLFQKSLYLSFYSKLFISYIFYLILITIIYTIFVIIKNNSFYVFDENLLIKDIKMLIYPIIAFTVYLFFTNFLKKNKNLHLFFNVILIFQILLIILLIFEVSVYKTHEIFLPFVHSDPSKYWRIRLLTMESSWSGSIVIIFSVLSIYFVNYLNKSKRLKILTYAISVFFLVYYTMHSESKGYLILLLLAFFPMLIANIYNNKRLRKFLALLLIPLFFLGLYVFSYLQAEIKDQLYTSITFGTRFTGYLAALESFVINPLGVGLGPYLEIYPNHIRNVIDYKFMSPFNLDEVSGYLGSPKFLSTKSYFFDNLIFGGIGFFIFFTFFYIKRYNSVSVVPNFSMLRIGLVYIILSGVFYLTFDIKYEVWLFLAVMDVLEKTNKNEIEYAT